MIMDPVFIEQGLSTLIDGAKAQWPWDAGYRADFYRAVASALIELADGLEEEADSLGYLEEEQDGN